jgi:hypothetical protein
MSNPRKTAERALLAVRNLPIVAPGIAAPGTVVITSYEFKRAYILCCKALCELRKVPMSEWKKIGEG